MTMKLLLPYKALQISLPPGGEDVKFTVSAISLLLFQGECDGRWEGAENKVKNLHYVCICSLSEVHCKT